MEENNIVQTKSDIKKEEYIALRNEITARIGIMHSHGPQVVTIMLSLLTIVVSAFYAKEFPISSLIENQNWEGIIFMYALIVAPAWIAVPFAAREGDNLRAIATIAMYLKYFHEVPSFLKNGTDGGGLYETVRNNIIGTEEPQKRKFFSRDSSIVLCLSMGLILTFGLSSMSLCDPNHESFGIFVACFAFSFFLTIVAFVLVCKFSSVKKNFYQEKKKCAEKFKKQAIKMKLYSEKECDSVQ